MPSTLLTPLLLSIVFVHHAYGGCDQPGFYMPTAVPPSDAATVRCWGDDMTRDDAIITRMPPNAALSMMDMGYYSVCGIDRSGVPVCWGRDDTGIVSSVPEAHALTGVSVGLYTACAVSDATTGGVWCWGTDTNYQMEVPVAALANVTVRDVSVGESVVCVLDDHSGLVHCWGEDESYQLSRMPRETPFSVVSVGRRVTCGLHRDTGVPVCWGSGTDSWPSASNETLSSLSVGAYVACGVRRDDNRTVVCWGDNTFGQVDVATDGGEVIAVSAGDGDMSCAITAPGGRMNCWGQDTSNVTASLPSSGVAFYTATITAHIVCALVHLESSPCVACNPGTSAAAAPNATAATNATRCVACTSGRYSAVFGASGGCEPCNAGEYCGHSNQLPVACPAGSFCAAGATSPVPCANHSYCAANATHESICPGGYVCETPAVIDMCAAGTYCPAGSMAPVACVLGEMCHAGSAHPELCNAGCFCPTPSMQFTCNSPGAWCPPGSTSEGMCEATWFCTTPSVRDLCPAGFMCPAECVQPVPCPPNCYCSRGVAFAVPCSTSCADHWTMVSPCTSRANMVCAPDSGDVKVPWLLLILLLVGGVCVLGVSAVLGRRTPDAKPMQLMQFVFTLVDLFSDCLFMVHVHNERSLDTWLWLFLAILLANIVLQAVCLGVSVSAWMERNAFLRWIDTRFMWFACVFVVSTIRPQAILIITSRVCHLNPLSAPLTRADERRIERLGSVNVLMMILPQLFIQVMVAIRLREINGPVGFALIVSAAQITTTLVMYFWMFVYQCKTSSSSSSFSSSPPSPSSSFSKGVDGNVVYDVSYVEISESRGVQ